MAGVTIQFETMPVTVISPWRKDGAGLPDIVDQNQPSWFAAKKYDAQPLVDAAVAKGS